jgi:hypothetical protein
MEERRKFSRVKFIADVEVAIDNQLFPGELVDISLNGALFRAKGVMELERGDVCELKFYLPSTDVTLRFNAQLVHEHQRQFGFKFISEDVETLTHLRRLIELNIGDAELVTHELSFLCTA